MFEYKSVKTAILEVADLEWNPHGTKTAVIMPRSACDRIP